MFSVVLLSIKHVSQFYSLNVHSIVLHEECPSLFSMPCIMQTHLKLKKLYFPYVVFLIILQCQVDNFSSIIQIHTIWSTYDRDFRDG